MAIFSFGFRSRNSVHASMCAKLQPAKGCLTSKAQRCFHPFPKWFERGKKVSARWRFDSGGLHYAWPFVNIMKKMMQIRLFAYAFY